MTPSEEGFYSRNKGGTRYVTLLSVTDSRGNPTAVFAEKVSEDAEDAVSRVNKNGKTVWEKHHDGIRLQISSVYIKTDSQFGPQLYIRGNTHTIQVPLNSNHATKFIACCDGIDLDQVCLFEPYKMEKTDRVTGTRVYKDGKIVYTQGWTIKQGGTGKDCKLENTLDMSREGPVPAMRQLKNKKWDSSDRDEFLLEHLNQWIEANGLDKKPASETSQDSLEDDEEEEDEEEETPAPPKKKKGTQVVENYGPIDEDSVPF
jgi:hypothetical protein